MLEDKFIDTMQYVELAPENYNAFSNEFASILMSVGAAISVSVLVGCI